MLRNRYVRLNAENDIGSTANDQKSFDTLIKNGNNMWFKPLNLNQSKTDL